MGVPGALGGVGTGVGDGKLGSDGGVWDRWNRTWVVIWPLWRSITIITVEVCMHYMEIHSKLSMQVIAAYQLCLWLRRQRQITLVIDIHLYVYTHDPRPSFYQYNRQ